MKKIATMSLTTLLFSTAALAGGSHESATTTTVYNDDNTTTTTNYSDKMTILGNPSYLYVGAELGWLNANLNNSTTGSGNDNYWTAAPIVGLRVGENLGFETSYSWGTSEDDFGNNADITNYAVDALGYLPINDAKTIEIVGLVGAGRYTFDSTAPGNDTDTAFRYGGGLQHEIGKNWSSRILYRHADVNTAALSGVDTITLGLTYNFR
jgi:opacity protein-like surface antigen